MNQTHYKMVTIVRSDLKMTRGKEVAQGQHAAMRLALKIAHEDPKVLATYFKTGETKICVRARSEEELLEIYQAALAAGLPTVLIADSGKTMFGGVVTHTVVGIGPAPSIEIDKITSNLSLY
jgi:PTH2 family peptidyl-tRNA hydrolase